MKMKKKNNQAFIAWLASRNDISMWMCNSGKERFIKQVRGARKNVCMEDHM